MFVYTSTRGAAIAIDEYVPTMMPTTIANAKWLMISPPNMNNARTVKNVNPDVKIVRLSVWLMLSFMIVSRASRRRNFKFSRIRSKTTIVSFME